MTVVNPYVLYEEIPNDPELRIYHSRLTLFDGQQQIAQRGLNEEYGEDIGICHLMFLVLKIPGVAVCDITPYRLAVRKSPVFSWAEIEQDIHSILAGVPTAIDSTHPFQIMEWRSPGDEIWKHKL